MTDPRHQPLDLRDLSDDDLGALLRQAFAFPAAPEVTPRVLDRIASTPSPGRIGGTWAWPRLSRGVLLALLGLIIAAAVAAAAILGVPGIRILTVGEVERPTPPVTAPASPIGRVGATLGLGIELSLDEIRRRVEMPVTPPADPSLGAPDAVYLDRTLAGGMVSMVWRARPDLPVAEGTGVGLLISQFDGEVNPQGFEKLRDQDVQVEQVSVGGASGWWLHGATHLFLRRVGSGDESHPVVPTRLAGDTLLWERDGLTYRLEGSIGLERAVQIATSITGNETGTDGVVPS